MFKFLNLGYKTLTLNISNRVADRIDHLAKQSNCKNSLEYIRKCLNFCDVVVQIMNEGGEIYGKHANGVVEYIRFHNPGVSDNEQEITC